MRLTLAALWLLLTATGCGCMGWQQRVQAVTDERDQAISAEMTSWVGHPLNEVIARWGPPTQRLPGEDGGEIAVWNPVSAPQDVTTKQRADDGSVRVVTTHEGGEVDRSQFRMFWTEAHGRIVRWQWQGRDYHP